MELVETIRDVLRTWSGRVGVAMIVVMAILALYAVLGLPYAQLSVKYTTPSAWPLYPKHVPPWWAVSSRAGRLNVTLDTSKLQPVAVSSRSLGGGWYEEVKVYSLTFDYPWRGLPSDTAVLLEAWKPSSVAAAQVTVYIERPDGVKVYLLNASNVAQNFVVFAALQQGNATIPLPLSEASESNPVKSTLEASLRSVDPGFRIPVWQAIWSNGDGDPVDGKYKLVVVVDEYINGGGGGDVRVVASIVTLPNYYGWFGTDSAGRPIGLGLLLGLPWAFIISLVTVFLAVLIGGVYGVVAGYARPTVGEILMRIADVVTMLPFLPILIVLTLVLGYTSIWMLIALMVALSWAGPVLVVRSIALQAKNSPYVEAAKAIGVSDLRIVLRYILPQAVPFLAAIAILGIPDPILTEAALAMLGLSDPTVPTWGKMLEWAWDSHAVVNGWWWSFLFPGLALAVYCAAFLLLGRALEPILTPKMRRS